MVRISRFVEYRNKAIISGLGSVACAIIGLSSPENMALLCAVVPMAAMAWSFGSSAKTEQYYDMSSHKVIQK